MRKKILLTFFCCLWVLGMLTLISSFFPSPESWLPDEENITRGGVWPRDFDGKDYLSLFITVEELDPQIITSSRRNRIKIKIGGRWILGRLVGGYSVDTSNVSFGGDEVSGRNIEIFAWFPEKDLRDGFHHITIYNKHGDVIGFMMEGIQIGSSEDIREMKKSIKGGQVFIMGIFTIALVSYLWLQLPKYKRQRARRKLEAQEANANLRDSFSRLGGLAGELIGEVSDEVVGGFERALNVARSGEVSRIEIRTALRAIDRELGRSADRQPTLSTGIVTIAGHRVTLGLLPTEQIHQLKDALELRLEEMEGEREAEEREVESSEPTAEERIAQENIQNLARLRTLKTSLQDAAREREAALESIDQEKHPELWLSVKHAYDNYMNELMNEDGR